MQRATYEYLRGNILDVFPEYKKDAEDHLSKAKRKSPMQRATYEYLRGNILDVFPEYKKDAEDHLSKAVFLRLSFPLVTWEESTKLLSAMSPNSSENELCAYLE
ncbi:tetratricopeptide repeat protein 5-like [Forsythia ovata]|uniref:Tetratricopeptide repeat protein 5-like n=1 Tax=Forsythia ovata TaxID=205694 RepID=A0ABD1T5D3_9LAMI